MGSRLSPKQFVGLLPHCSVWITPTELSVRVFLSCGWKEESLFIAFKRWQVQDWWEMLVSHIQTSCLGETSTWWELLLAGPLESTALLSGCLLVEINQLAFPGVCVTKKGLMVLIAIIYLAMAALAIIYRSANYINRNSNINTVKCQNPRLTAWTKHSYCETKAASLSPLSNHQYAFQEEYTPTLIAWGLTIFAHLVISLSFQAESSQDRLFPWSVDCIQSQSGKLKLWLKVLQWIPV